MTKPTRGPHLLDLVLSDFASGIRCRVVPGIHGNDHDGVLTTVDLDIPAAHPVERVVYDFKKQIGRCSDAAYWKQIGAAS